MVVLLSSAIFVTLQVNVERYVIGLLFDSFCAVFSCFTISRDKQIRTIAVQFNFYAVMPDSHGQVIHKSLLFCMCVVKCVSSICSA